MSLFIDRGILMTFGNGVHGSLGHGNHNDVVHAKIVEALIGFEVEQVRTGLQQVLCIRYMYTIDVYEICPIH